jgi:hypothetical protein
MPPREEDGVKVSGVEVADLGALHHKGHRLWTGKKSKNGFRS